MLDALSDIELKQILITTDGRGKTVKEEALELLLKRKEYKFVTGSLDFSGYGKNPTANIVWAKNQ